MTADRLSLAHGRNVYRCGFGSFIVKTCAEKSLSTSINTQSVTVKLYTNVARIMECGAMVVSFEFFGYISH